MIFIAYSQGHHTNTNPKFEPPRWRPKTKGDHHQEDCQAQNLTLNPQQPLNQLL